MFFIKFLLEMVHMLKLSTLRFFFSAYILYTEIWKTQTFIVTVKLYRFNSFLESFWVVIFISNEQSWRIEISKMIKYPAESEEIDPQFMKIACLI